MKFNEIGNEYAPGLIKEMRSWVEDCAADEEELENIRAASAAAILWYVEREYCGGIAAFIKEYNAMMAG